MVVVQKAQRHRVVRSAIMRVTAAVLDVTSVVEIFTIDDGGMRAHSTVIGDCTPPLASPRPESLHAESNRTALVLIRARVC